MKELFTNVWAEFRKSARDIVVSCVSNIAVEYCPID